MSEISYSETSSIFTSTGTITSFSSTIPGIGALSGKAFKRFGSAVVNGVDAILIRRRLVQIETTFGPRLDGSTDSTTSKSLYSDLLELSRPVYSLSIRTRAFRLIMGKIGAMDVEDLAAAVASWPLSESYDLIKAIMHSLCLEGNEALDLSNTSGADRSARLEVYCAVGLDAYKSHLPYASFQRMSRMSLCLAFLLFMGLTVASSKSPAFSRLVIELDLVTFITDTYPDPWLRHLFPAQMMLSALLDKLDPEKDATSITRLQELLLDINPLSSYEQDPPSPSNQTIFSPIMSKGDLLSSIRSNIIYLQSSVYKKRCILLLGSGESGKTTLKKQMMKAYYWGLFPDGERKEYIEPIVGNAFIAFCRVVDADTMGQYWRENEASPHHDIAQYDSADAPNKPSIPSNISDLQNIMKSWIDPQKRSLPYYNDYFFDSLPRILSEGYLPSDEDIVRCYIRTTGIHTETIDIRGNPMTLLDFGGQRSERRKWIHAFQERKAGLIFFVASLSDYNEGLFEDESVNRMQESLTLFDSIVNSRRFEDVPVVLFLNKTDLFAQKLRNIPLKDYFPDYSGGDDYSAGCQFFIDKFLECSKRPSGGWDTRVYLTSFIDDEQIKNIMNEIYDTYMDPSLSFTAQSVPQAPQAPMQVQVSVSTTKQYEQ